LRSSETCTFAFEGKLQSVSAAGSSQRRHNPLRYPAGRDGFRVTITTGIGGMVGKIDPAEEASEESFPASDAPTWAMSDEGKGIAVSNNSAQPRFECRSKGRLVVIPTDNTCIRAQRKNGFSPPQLEHIRGLGILHPVDNFRMRRRPLPSPVADPSGPPTPDARSGIFSFRPSAVRTAEWPSGQL